MPTLSPHRALRFLSIAALASGIALLGARARAQSPAASAQSARRIPSVLLDEGYAGSTSCAECHARNDATWRASYHRRMTQAATPGALLAPVPSRTPPLDGVTWSLTRDGDATFATALAEGASGAEHVLARPLRVEITTGSHHYQVLWLATPDGAELTQLPLVWHVAEQRWIPRRSVFLEPPNSLPSFETGRWAQTCVKCHVTNGTAQHASDGGTHAAELGIACEACHGPAARHVAAERDFARRRAADPALTRDVPDDARLVNPAELPHDRSSEVCGQCHGIFPLVSERARAWEREGFAYRPGDVLATSRDVLRGVRERNGERLRGFLERHPETLGELFWADGQVRVSGREYNGLVESACFEKGELSCLSCHELHPAADDPRPLATWADDQLAPGGGGPAACLACHTAFAEPAALAAHTHHAPKSSGSDCLNCHMPYTTYGLTKAIRSHTITSPRLADALVAHRPVACNQCHLDRTLGWTADQLHTWYGAERPELTPDQETVSAAVLDALTGDAGVRALAAWSFGWTPARAVSGTGWMPYVLSTLLQDPYDAVRFVAQRTTRLDPRYANLALEFTQDLEVQRAVVRAGILTDWRREGLRARPEQRAALLLLPDGRLDEPRFQALYSRVDARPLRLAE